MYFKANLSFNKTKLCRSQELKQGDEAMKLVYDSVTFSLEKSAASQSQKNKVHRLVHGLDGASFRILYDLKYQDKLLCH